MKRLQFDTKNYRYIKLLGIAALLSGAAILFNGCENNIEEIKAFALTENLPVLEARNFETLVTDSGQVRYLLKAPKLLQFDDEGRNYTEFPEGMELVKFDEKRRIISSITANYAKEFAVDNKWEAKNNVIATNAQGDTLKTEHLIYEENKDLIHTEEFVTIISADKIITGTGLTSDISLQNWKIKNPKGTIYISVNNENKQTDSTQINPVVNTNPQKPAKEQLQFNNR